MFVRITGVWVQAGPPSLRRRPDRVSGKERASYATPSDGRRVLKRDCVEGLLKRPSGAEGGGSVSPLQLTPNAQQRPAVRHNIGRTFPDPPPGIELAPLLRCPSRARGLLFRSKRSVIYRFGTTVSYCVDVPFPFGRGSISVSNRQEAQRKASVAPFNQIHTLPQFSSSVLATYRGSDATKSVD